MCFTQLFEQICVHYKNLENEEKQTKMKQKAFIYVTSQQGPFVPVYKLGIF